MKNENHISQKRFPDKPRHLQPSDKPAVLRSEIERILENMQDGEIPVEILEGIIQLLIVSENRSAPFISPEVAKIVFENNANDNERKFQFLTQKQVNDAEGQKRADAQKKRKHNFKRAKHTNHFTLLKPIVWTVLLTVFGSTVAGIWLCWIGKEAIGAAILTGMWGAVFGYLGGSGTSNTSRTVLGGRAGKSRKSRKSKKYFSSQTS